MMSYCRITATGQGGGGGGGAGPQWAMRNNVQFDLG
jgi:hypothetical protein